MLKALRLQRYLHVVTGDELVAGGFLLDIADDGDVLHLFDLLEVGLFDGEHQFVVVAAVEGSHGMHNVQILEGHEGEFSHRKFFFKQYAPFLGSPAYLYGSGGESFAHIGHGGGEDLLLAQFLDDVDARLGLELAAQEVVLACEVGLRAGVLLKDLLLAFEEQQTGVGCREIAGDADEFVLGRALAGAQLRGSALPYRGDGDDQFAS